MVQGWLEADDKLANQCKEEICEYYSDSAYKGYMMGFKDGIKSQAVEVSKQDVADAFRGVYGKIDGMSGLVGEEDCVNYISSSEQYWFFAGAMWLMKQINNNE